MRKRLLTILRVPERPDPPPGAGAELETFRAERGFFHYSVLMWFPKQVAAFAGLMFSLSFFGSLDNGRFDFMEAKGWDLFVEKLDEADIGFAWLRFELTDILTFFEALAIATWVSQLVFTGLLLKLSWELRWYMVGERSLRLRHGLWSVREQTMTIANIQNMIVRQGPIQRLFGISDLDVHTAGGGAAGSSGEDPTQQKDGFHVGRFRGIADASALRDKIRLRLQAVKKGEADGPGASAGTEPEAGGPEGVGSGPGRGAGDLATAALALLGEARALRRSLT